MPDGPDKPRKPSKKRADRQRRVKGTGSIFWSEPRQKYVGRKIVGRKVNGAPLYREVSDDKESEVVRKLADLGPPSDTITVRGWSAVWLDTLTIRDSTRADYREVLDHHILPVLGSIRVAEVKTSRIKSLARQLTDKKLAEGTIKKILSQLGAMFEAAVREEIIKRNPVVVDGKRQGEKQKIRPFTRAELIRIIESIPPASAGPLIALLAAVGCRVGEAAALDVADWNPETGKLSITKTFSRRFGIGPPKSKHGTREISAPDIVHPLLTAAVESRTTGPLFLTGKGNRVVKELVTRSFLRLLGRLKLARRNVHQLRHSVATAMVAEGVPIADVAEYLGDTVETIVSTYTHPTEVDPVLLLNKIFRKVN
ncbi:MAG: site-specific integrase [Gemmataceae bacterium]|nr:site-specific integrase [Gemmataceae bacterium]